MKPVPVEIRPVPRILLVSPSEIDAFRQCPHKHELAYKERWVEPSVSPALSRGKWWHSIMEIHYNMLRWMQGNEKVVPIDPKPVIEQARDEILAVLEEAGEEGDLLRWMFDGYVEHWRAFDAEWEILAVEKTYVVWLPNPSGKRSTIRMKIKVDLIVRDRITGQIYVVDHKTGKDLPKQKELDIDDQFALYVWALRSLGYKVFGSIHNAARTQRNKDQVRNFQPLNERFSRTRLHRTDQELDTVALEAYATVETAWRYYRGERTPPRAPNPDTCRWRCSFTDPCLTGRKLGPNRERAMLLDLGFRQNFERH